MLDLQLDTRDAVPGAGGARTSGLRGRHLLAVAALAAVAAMLAPDMAVRVAAGAVAAALILLAGGLRIAALLRARRERRRLDDIMVFVEHDAAPAFCTDAFGAVVLQNRAAADRFGAARGDALSRVFEPLFANPDAVVHRVREGLRRDGRAREDVVTRRGHVRVSAGAIPGGELWRVEDMADRPARTGDGIGLPMLTASASGTILYMNETLRRAIGRRAKRLEDVFEDLPLRDGGIHAMRAEGGARPVRIAASRPVADRREIFVLPVEEGVAQREKAGVETVLDQLPIALVHIDEKGHVVSANRLALRLLPRSTEGNPPLAALVEGLGRSVSEWVADGAEGRGLYRPEVVRVTGAGEAYLQITLGRPLQSGDRGLIAFLNDATELKSIEAQFVQSQKMQAIGQLAGGVAHDFNNLLTAISGHCDLLLLRRGDDDPDFADLSQINQNANRAAALVGQLLAFSRKQTLKMQQLDLRDTLGDMTHLLNRLLGERVRLVVSHDPALIPIRGDRRQLEQVVMNLVVNARDAMPEGGEVRIATECRYLESGMTRDRVTIPPGQYVVVSVSDGGAGIEPEKIGRIFEPFFTTKRPGEGTGLGLSMAYGIMKQSGGYIFADSTPGEGATFSLYFPAGRDAVAPFPAEVAIPEDEPAADFAAPAPRPVAGLPSAPDLPPEEGRDGAATDDREETGRPVAEDGDTPVDLDRVIAATVDLGEASVADPTSDGDEMPCRLDVGDDGDAPVREIPAPASHPSDHSPAAPSGCTVLLVEDEAPVRAFASRALRLKGYRVLEASCAEDALARLDDETLDVDLFVTDVMMPGLDGPTWVRRARERRPDVWTIFVSGYTQDTMSETAAPVPNSYFLPKPFSLAELTRTVQKAVGEGTRRAG
ncbi:ATP-binding protein [Jannaschia sp. W003]|uniref:hybrid sensor histidine kinase/response regulator n=1 Tax=Jannaschia sp. W003 TaxID=2867012 RepID=UPI0021A556FA|nr:ATP-binding protein [Jannaschia sp. W003]UWQ20323.1 response regulator [Jannaschia sp. W003]